MTSFAFQDEPVTSFGDSVVGYHRCCHADIAVVGMVQSLRKVHCTNGSTHLQVLWEMVMVPLIQGGEMSWTDVGMSLMDEGMLSSYDDSEASQAGCCTLTSGSCLD